MKIDNDLKFVIAALMFVLLSLVVKAQEQVISDTTYVVNRGDTVFQVKQIAYNTGRKTIDETPVGRDTASVLKELRQQAYNLSQQYALAMLYIESESSFRRTIAGFSSAIQTVINRTYFEDSDRVVGIGNTLIGTYGFRINGGNQLNASIIRNTQGLLRFRVNNTNYPIDIYSELLIRIRNYEGIDFFLVRTSAEATTWSGGQRRYILRKQ